MTVEHKLITGESFEQFLATHRDGLYELIHGEIVEKVPTQEHAKIAGIILGELYLYLNSIQRSRPTWGRRSATVQKVTSTTTASPTCRYSSLISHPYAAGPYQAYPIWQ